MKRLISNNVLFLMDKRQTTKVEGGAKDKDEEKKWEQTAHHKLGKKESMGKKSHSAKDQSDKKHISGKTKKWTEKQTTWE